MGRLIQFFYSANGPWQAFHNFSLSTSDAVSWAIRLSRLNNGLPGLERKAR